MRLPKFVLPLSVIMISMRMLYNYLEIKLSWNQNTIVTLVIQAVISICKANLVLWLTALITGRFLFYVYKSDNFWRAEEQTKCESVRYFITLILIYKSVYLQWAACYVGIIIFIKYTAAVFREMTYVRTARSIIAHSSFMALITILFSVMATFSAFHDFEPLTAFISLELALVVIDLLIDLFELCPSLSILRTLAECVYFSLQFSKPDFNWLVIRKATEDIVTFIILLACQEKHEEAEAEIAPCEPQTEARQPEIPLETAKLSDNEDAKDETQDHDSQIEIPEDKSENSDVQENNESENGDVQENSDVQEEDNKSEDDVNEIREFKGLERHVCEEDEEIVCELLCCEEEEDVDWEERDIEVSDDEDGAIESIEEDQNDDDDMDSLLKTIDDIENGLGEVQNRMFTRSLNSSTRIDLGL